MDNETSSLQRIRLACSRGACRLFRNNVGAVKLPTGRLLQYGLCQGSGDLIGWKTITIQIGDVGKQVAVFVSVEVKTAKGCVSETQTVWLDAVNRAGGIAIIARSPAEAEAALK